MNNDALLQLSQALADRNLDEVRAASSLVDWDEFYYQLRPHVAAQDRPMSVSGNLLPKVDENTPQTRSAWEGFVEAALESMMSGGYRVLDDPTVRSWAGWSFPVLSPLARVVLRKGCCMDNGGNLLHMSLQGHRIAPDELSVLLREGVSVHEKNDLGMTPLVALILHRDFIGLVSSDEERSKKVWDALELLVRAGAELHAAEPDERSARMVIQDTFDLRPEQGALLSRRLDQLFALVQSDTLAQETPVVSKSAPRRGL